MLGILPNKNTATTLAFKNAGDKIYLIGERVEDINCSEYLYSYHGVKLSPAPYFDLDKEYDMQQTLIKVIEKGLVQSAHDVSEGGVFVALAEAAMPNKLGFDVLTDSEIRQDAFLFGESQGRVIVSVSKKQEDAFVDMMVKSKIPFIVLGEVTKKGKFVIDDETYMTVEEAANIYDNALEKLITE
jgi:phosphoribosylformylglycinamidine synthase